MLTSVTNLTEGAEKKRTLAIKHMKDPPETIPRTEANTKANSGPVGTKKD